MLTRRLLPLSLAAALLTVGCSSTTPDTTDTKVGSLDENKKVEITWWHGQNVEAADLLASLAREYESDHPNVTIRDASGASTTDELLQKLQAGFAADTAPDISYAFGSWATELGTSGRTLDISEQVNAADSGWEEFPEAARATATVDGRVIGMPAIVDNLGLIYNKDLFDQAGLDYPTNDWTWEDFRAAAKAISDPATNLYGTAYPVSGTEDTTWRFWPQLWQNGGQVLDDEGKPAFNSQAGVDALEYWRALAQDDKSVYLDQNGEKYGEAFYAGRIGMIISGPWLLYDLVAKKVNYGITYLPGTDGNHQTISGPDLWVLLDHGDKQRAAASYDFVNWLTSPEQDVRWNLAYGNLPLRDVAADTPEFVKYVADYPGAEVFLANLANATEPRPTVEGYNAMSVDIAKAINSVLVGDADAQEALDRAAESAALELVGP